MTDKKQLIEKVIKEITFGIYPQNKYCEFVHDKLESILSDFADELIDKLLPIPEDFRRYLSIISDMQKNWKGGKKDEYLAMDYIARKIYYRFIEPLAISYCEKNKPQPPKDMG